MSPLYAAKKVMPSFIHASSNALLHKSLALFETVVNTVHKAAANTAIAFNTRPEEPPMRPLVSSAAADQRFNPSAGNRPGRPWAG